MLVLCLGASAASVPLAAQCPDGSPPPCAGARAPRSAPLSVAVLYFDNASRDSNDAYLADGLTEQTIARLGDVGRLTVASRFAVRRFRGGPEQDPAAVGRSLNVAYLVTGSVRRAGNRLRIGVELVRAGTGVRVWGEEYDRTDADILRIQDDIAASVATGIVGRLLPAERRAVSARTTRNPEAWDHFLRGNFSLARRDGASLMQAVRSYQAAVALDPTFTDAVARIAYAYAVMLDNEVDVGLPRDTLVARGVAMAERAVQLDSLSSDVWLARAYLRMASSPLLYDGVRERFARALALNPRSAEAHHQFASYLAYMGDTAGAVRENRRALELEPGRAITWFQLASIANAVGQPREAIRFSDSAAAADPGFTLVKAQYFNAYLILGDTVTARRTATALAGIPTFQVMGMFLGAFLSARGGDPASRGTFVGFMRNTPPSPTQPGNAIFGGWAAMLFTQLGDRDNALAMLESVQPRAMRLHDIMRNPLFDPIRGEPRFQAIFNETRAPGAAW